MFFRAAVDWALGLFRRFLQVRAVFTTVVLSGLALLIVGAFLSYSIGNGLYQTRITQILAESKRGVVEVQNTFSASTVTDEIALQTLLNSVVPSLESSGTSDSRRVALLRTPGQVGSQILQSPISADLDTAVIPVDLKSEVRNATRKLTYQSVPLPQPNGSVHPGVVVGAPIEIPLAGKYELYLVFDLYGEQQTLDFVQSILFWGMLILLFMIGAVSYFVTNWLVRPVQVAAEVSEEIAEGALDRRLTERGEDVIAILARSFNRMADSLQKQITKLASVSKMQQRFVSDVSHELRTPLTTIKLAGDVIFASREKLEPAAKRSAELMHDQIERFEVLLSDLLEISRYDAGAVAADLEIQDLNGIVGSAIAGLEPLAQSRGCEIQIQIPSGAVDVEVDGRRIERLVRNLLANAIEHGENKPIRVAVGISDTAVAVSVTDSGVGMSRTEVDRVFDRFWRADPARKRTTGGTGLGLAISLEDTQLHGGWLQVWAKPNEGASFRLTLPRRQGMVFTQSPLPLPPKKTRPKEAGDE
ncbi:MAG: HAMP domain-containing protein [Actinobacteria bacterium]|uniref:Sensor histidine kinase MtrB n=1 Tax=freshwater metagenome TaxID=449393 RepID=A0A6J6IJ92_9ZZZZ|nr:HAMP domain-containing protein [Actinomycetota bacterium]